MRLFNLIFILLAFALPGCTVIHRMVHMYGSEAPQALSFKYKDGGSSTYYSFVVGGGTTLDSLVFFYGGTGCPSWKSVMPAYVDGLAVNARVFVLNKRFVSDRSTGLFDCGRDFHLANNPEQWVADYSEFIAAQVASASPQPKNVVLVGVSEGALSAARVADLSPVITHLAIIGSGGYSMRKSLVTLKKRGAIEFDVDSGWKKISADPRSIEKKWYGNTYRWWSDVMDLDPLPDLLKLRMPILLGMGEKDKSVPVESAWFLEKKFKEVGKDNLAVRIYPGADHRLSGNGVSYRSEFFVELSRLVKATNQVASKRHISSQSGPRQLH
jgi:pimeloyl-ACP methyl ester carboxylesterase